MKFLVFFQAWQHAQSMVLRKKEQKARHEMGGKTDKIPGTFKKRSKNVSRALCSRNFQNEKFGLDFVV